VTSALRPSAAPEALAADLAGRRLLERCGAALERRLDPSSRAPVCVGFSGGSDSLALLLAARAWAQQAGRPVLALTVDHGLQPPSAAWTQDAGRTARRLGVGFRALVWQGSKPQTGLPAAARRARHALLAQAAREAGARVLLLGHTGDDLIEAERMREAGLSVGSPREWAPSPVWPEGRDIFLLRPLLEQRRADLRQILAEHRFSWIEDPANEDLRFARARARIHLPSPLEGEGSREGGYGAAPLPRPLPLEGEGEFRASRDLFADPGLLGIACVCAGGAERPPRRARTERLAGRIASGEAFTATLAGARIEVADNVLISRDPGRVRQVMALAPGQEAVWDGRFLARSDRACVVRPLSGAMSRLPARERAALRAIPATARPGLPLFQSGETVTCPILAQSAWASVRSLVGGRLAGACGRFAREIDLGSALDGDWTSGALS
jgi:tRNA(Ile)-lysidine synthase